MNATDDQQNYDADFENAINKKGNPEKMKKKSMFDCKYLNLYMKFITNEVYVRAVCFY